MSPGEENGNTPRHELLSVAVTKRPHKEAVPLPVSFPAHAKKAKLRRTIGVGGVNKTCLEKQTLRVEDAKIHTPTYIYGKEAPKKKEAASLLVSLLAHATEPSP